MSEIWSALQLPFMQEALLVATLIAIPTALLSCFVVLKGWALMGDAVSHAVLPGVVLAYLVGLPLLLGAFLAGLGCTLASGFVSQHSRIKRDTALGVVFAGLFGLGLVLFSAVESDLHLDLILFGNILGIEPSEFWTALLVCGSVTLWLVLRRRDLLLHSFDPTQARVLGLNAAQLHYGLLVALSLVIVAALSLVGLVLTLGLLIAPGATAFLLTRRFALMQLLAVVLALLSSWGGLLLSLVWGSATGPTIILLQTAFFTLAFVISGRKGAMQAGKAPPRDLHKVLRL